MEARPADDGLCMHLLEKSFSELGLTDTASRIYIQLVELGTASARQLAESLSLPRPSVYDNLKLLIQNSLVVERNEGGKKMFHVDDMRHLPELVREKIDILREQETAIRKILPELKKRTASSEPRIRFFPGIEGLRRVHASTLWYENSEVLWMWSFPEMIPLLGEEYFYQFNRKRIRHNVFFRAIHPDDQRVDIRRYPFAGTGQQMKRTIRIAPRHMSWDMGMLIFGNTVGFMSSHREAFGFTIQSRDFANLMRMQFEVLWKISTPTKPQFSEDFLKTV